MKKKINLFEKLLLKISPPFMQRKIFNRTINKTLQIDKNICIKLAQTPAEIEGAFNVLYHSYIKERPVNSNIHQLKVTKYHTLPTTQIIIIKKENKVIGTMSIFPDSKLGLPCEGHWDISSLRQEDPAICEISSLAILREEQDIISNHFIFIIIFLERLLKHTLNLNTIIFAVHPKAKLYYQYILGAKVFSSNIVSYQPANNPLAIGMSANINAWRQNLKKYHNGKAKNKSLYYLFTEKKLTDIFQFPQEEFWDGVGNIFTATQFKKYFFDIADLNNNTTEQEKKVISSFYSSFLHKNFFTLDKKNIQLESRENHRYLCNMSGNLIRNDLIIQRIKIIDSSLNGIGLIMLDSDDTIQIGTTLNISVDLSSDEKTYISGTINFKEKDKVGLYITANSPRWDDFINYLQKKYSGLEAVELLKDAA